MPAPKSGKNEKIAARHRPRIGVEEVTTVAEEDLVEAVDEATGGEEEVVAEGDIEEGGRHAKPFI